MTRVLQTVDAVRPDRKLSDYLRDLLRKFEKDLGNGLPEGLDTQTVHFDGDTLSATYDITVNSSGNVGVGMGTTDPSTGKLVVKGETDFGRGLHVLADTNWGRIDVSGLGYESNGLALYQTQAGIGVLRNLADASSIELRQDGVGLIRFIINGAELLRFEDNRARMVAGGFREDSHAITGSNPSIDPANGQMQLWSLTANESPTVDDFENGDSVTLHIADGTAYTITWPAAIRWVGGTAPVLDTTHYTIVVLWKFYGIVFGSAIGAASTA